MSDNVRERIIGQISKNPILLYMKGSPDAPQCGFSKQAAQALIACAQKFAYVDILADPEVRADLPKYANFPTFPQLWLNGELIGGSDIIASLHEEGELLTMLTSATAAADRAQA